MDRLETLLDVLPIAVALVEVGSTRPLHLNAAAKRLPHVFSAEGVAPEAWDTGGQALSVDQLPCALAGRGDRVRNRLVHWREPDGIRSYAIDIDGFDRDGHELRILVVHDVTELQTSQSPHPERPLSHDEFLSVAAHELRSPLAALQLLLQRMKLQATRSAKLEVSEVLSSLERGLRQIARLTMLVQNLLDVSRMRTQRFHLEVEEFDMCTAVNDITYHAREVAQRAGSSLEVDASGTLVGSWDRTRVEQVIGNLLSNAIKYGNSKPIRVTLRARDERVLLQVDDQGIGIADDDHARIFEPFERAASAFRSQSLGLGLYIVREIVHAHGGEVRVSSTLGQGSSFTVELPRHTQARSPSSLPTSRPAGGADGATLDLSPGGASI